MPEMGDAASRPRRHLCRAYERERQAASISYVARRIFEPIARNLS